MTGEKGPATELKPGTCTISQSFSHKLSVPVANPSFPITLCTGRRCAAIQRPLEDLCLEAATVRDGNGLSGRQRVAWTRVPVVGGVSCLCLAMLVCFFGSRWKRCKDFSANTAQEERCQVHAIQHICN